MLPRMPSVGPTLIPKRIHRHADAVPAALELQDVDERAAVARLVVVRRLCCPDLGAEQILERMLGEMQGPGV